MTTRPVASDQPVVSDCTDLIAQYIEVFAPILAMFPEDVPVANYIETLLREGMDKSQRGCVLEAAHEQNKRNKQKNKTTERNGDSFVCDQKTQALEIMSKKFENCRRQVKYAEKPLHPGKTPPSPLLK
jgi:hypothetical protein